MTQFKYHDNANKGGTYQIANIENGRAYFGSAQCFKKRWAGHVNALKANRHSNKFLQADWNKCGESDFVFEVIESITGSKEERLDAEQKLLTYHWDNCNLCYNISKWAISCQDRHFSKNPEETRRKMRMAKLGKKRGPMSEETKRKIGLANSQKPISEEMRARLAVAMKGKHHTLETRNKISATMKRLGLKPQLWYCTR